MIRFFSLLKFVIGAKTKTTSKKMTRKKRNTTKKTQTKTNTTKTMSIVFFNTTKTTIFTNITIGRKKKNIYMISC